MFISGRVPLSKRVARNIGWGEEKEKEEGVLEGRLSAEFASWGALNY